MTNVWCSQHRGYVHREDARIVGVEETDSGPGIPSYACMDCIREHGLLTLADHRAAAYVGRPDLPPIPPQDAA